MNQALYDSLTLMERNCLRLAHHACKTEQIGHRLDIKPSTVNSHIFSARKKLGGISRLAAADQLRRFEEGADDRADTDHRPDHAERNGRRRTEVGAPQSLSRQTLRMAEDADHPAGTSHPAEVREHRSVFVFDDDRLLAPGGEDQQRDAILRRLALILAIAALTALVLIAAPAIYDSTAQRIANSLERPHE